MDKATLITTSAETINGEFILTIYQRLKKTRIPLPIWPSRKKANAGVAKKAPFLVFGKYVSSRFLWSMPRKHPNATRNDKNVAFQEKRVAPQLLHKRALIFS